ncbi:MAG TPA: hypothetical protein VNN15_05400 [Solirubrobacterales bacterium]|nr:hypothetical protein [Solirubrobacterales bacterium]
MDLKPNEPLLADVRAPWDAGWRVRDVLKPKNFWHGIVYNRKHKGFWAPSSMDPWRYRRFLKDLDEVCMRSLKSHGALTAKELAEWLSRERLLRTKPERTGIHRISVATAHDWITLAHRRGLVVPWGNTVERPGRVHWELSEQGRESTQPKFVRFIREFPLLSLLPFVAGGLAGALEWLTLHQVVIAVLVYAFLLALAVAVPSIWVNRSERRENPGIAVVAIETLRSAGKPIPTLAS